MAGSEPLLLTPEEAAERLRIGRTRLYGLLAEGAIQSVQIGRSRRIPLLALNQYVDRLSGHGEEPLPTSGVTVAGPRNAGATQPSHRLPSSRDSATSGFETLPLFRSDQTKETP